MPNTRHVKPWLNIFSQKITDVITNTGPNFSWSVSAYTVPGGLTTHLVSISRVFGYVVVDMALAGNCLYGCVAAFRLPVTDTSSSVDLEKICKR